jgi:hypothetical protein
MSSATCKANRTFLYIWAANQLAAPGGLLQNHKLGKTNYYVNQSLYDLLAQME